MVEDLGFTRFGLGDQRLIEDIKNILADFLEFGLNLLAVIANGTNVLLGSLGFLLLLDGRDDAPRSTSCADHILVCDREEVTFIDSEFTTELVEMSAFRRSNTRIADSTAP